MFFGVPRVKSRPPPSRNMPDCTTENEQHFLWAFLSPTRTKLLAGEDFCLLLCPAAYLDKGDTM